MAICLRPIFSLCTDMAYGACFNGYTNLEGSSGWVCGLQISGNYAGFTGRGLYIFTPNGGRYYGGFSFQEEYGDYESLMENSGGNLRCLRQFGDASNFSRPFLTLTEGYALLGVEVSMFEYDEECTETQLCVPPAMRNFKSLVFQGSGSWTIIGRNPNHRICIQASNTSLPYPAIITDMRQFGFDIEWGNIAQIIFGSSSCSGNVVVVDNSRARGVLVPPGVEPSKKYPNYESF
ncbi:unnamed protein product [Orchesella dallaii]|uniref:Uncharacterized protein n=1 Tax=Orchesella dallaii TaxID=48710 RepID=A0ABP1RZA6_9HEXA